MNEFWASDPIAPSAPSAGATPSAGSGGFWSSDPIVPQSNAPAAAGPAFGSDEYIKSLSQKHGVAPDYIQGLVHSQTQTSAIEGAPIIGGPLERSGPSIAAFVQPVTGAGAPGETYAARVEKNRALMDEIRSDFKREHPTLDIASQLIGGTLATAPLAGTAAVARMLGMSGTLPAQIVRGGLSNAAISAADAATRGGDVGTAAGIGGGIGAAVPIVGRGIGAVVGTQASRAAAKAVPTIDQTLAEGVAALKSPEVTGVTFKPNTIEDVSNIVKSDLNRSKLNERLAKGPHDILEEMKTPINGVAHTYEDVQTSRELLSKIAGNFANPTEQAAATQAIKTLDKLVETLPQSKLASGDIAAMNAKIADFRGNYSTGMAAQRVAEKIRNADLQNASTYSRGNLMNATKQKLRPILTTKSGSRGYTPEELQTIEDNVRGSTLGNFVQGVGKFAGGSGGFPAAIAAIVGHMFGGPAGAIALLGAGYGTRKIGDAITRANANKITNQILARSPLGLQRAAAQQSLPPAQRLNLLRALLLSNTATMPNIQMPQGQQ